MAKIILEPGEIFEHFHNQKSQTTLLEGEAKLNFLNQNIVLIPERPIEVPAFASHTLTNTGKREAVIWCSH